MAPDEAPTRDDHGRDDEKPFDDLVKAFALGREVIAEGGMPSMDYRRRLAEALRDATPEQRAAVIADLQSELGAASPDELRVAAIERLTEVHASGRIDEETFQREKRRLENY